MGERLIIYTGRRNAAAVSCPMSRLVDTKFRYKSRTHNVSIYTDGSAKSDADTHLATWVIIT